MMKKQMLLVMCFALCAGSVFGGDKEELPFMHRDSFWDAGVPGEKLYNLNTGFCDYYVNGDSFYVANRMKKIVHWFSLSNSLKIDNNLWQYIEEPLEEWAARHSQEPEPGSPIEIDYFNTVIYGGGYFALFGNIKYDYDFYSGDLILLDRGPTDSSSDNIVREVKDYHHDIVSNDVEYTYHKMGAKELDFIDNRIKSISSSSFHSENLKLNNNVQNVKYNTDFLTMLWVGYEKYFYLTEWFRHFPWVPGKKNNADGIGEELYIEYKTPTDNLIVLNGYVDPLRRSLYRANNRLKTVRITSTDPSAPFEIEYVFDDYVHFSEIDFPQKTSSVKMTILDVYKGDKWNDTCVQAVITRESR